MQEMLPGGVRRAADRVRQAGTVGAVLAACLVAASLAGCSTSTETAFDLTAPGQAPRGGAGGGAQLVVAEPTGISTFEDQHILARDAAGSVSYVGGAQWADRLPRLLQARLIQTFENGSRVRAVGRPGDGVTPDFQLNSEIRAFQLDASRGEAFVQLSERLLDAKTGKIVRVRVFTSRVPVPDANGGTVAQALDRALSSVLLDVVHWVSTGR